MRRHEGQLAYPAITVAQTDHTQPFVENRENSCLMPHTLQQRVDCLSCLIRRIRFIGLGVFCLHGCGHEGIHEEVTATSTTMKPTDYPIADDPQTTSMAPPSISCQSDTECGSLGEWRRCIDDGCVLDVRHRTAKIHDISVKHPQFLADPLHPALLEALGQHGFNLLVHVDDSLTWLIQGIESGRVAGRQTSAQNESSASYGDDRAWAYTQDSCTTEFVPHSPHNRLRWNSPSQLPGLRATTPVSFSFSNGLMFTCLSC